MIKIVASSNEVCRDALEIFVERVQACIAENDRFTVALSGGSTPNLLYDMLALPHNAQRVNWQKVFVFWGDERYVPYHSPDNNSYQAKLHLLDKVQIPEENIFRVPVTGDFVADAIAYQQTIQTFFGAEVPSFDLIFLGMGDEGHTASIFPGSSLLTEQEAIVKDIYVEQKQMQRISFTPLLINAAEEVIFMIAGKAKAPALREVLYGAYNPNEYPAQIVKPVSGNLTWLLDEDAAAEI